MLSFRRTKAGRIVAVLVLMMMLIGTLPPGTAFAEEPAGLEPQPGYVEETPPEDSIIPKNPDHLAGPEPEGGIAYQEPLTIPEAQPAAPMKSKSRMLMADTAEPPQWVKDEINPQTYLPNDGDVVVYEPIITEDPLEANLWEVKLLVAARDSVNTSDIVLVIDTSGSMDDNGRIEKAKESANAFVTNVLDGSPGTRIAVVQFNYNASVVSPFSSDKDALETAINGLTADGGTHTQGGVHAARTLLNASQADKKYMVVLSDGQPTYSNQINNPDNYLTPSNVTSTNVPESAYIYSQRVGTGNSLTWQYDSWPWRYYHHGNSAIAEAGFAKKPLGDNIHMYTIGLQTDDVGSGILRNMASSPDEFYEVTDVNQLQPVFEAIGADILKATNEAKVDTAFNNGFILPEGFTAAECRTSPGSTVTIGDDGKPKWNIGTISTPLDEVNHPNVKYEYLVFKVTINDKILEYDNPTKLNPLANIALVYKDINGDEQSITFPEATVSPKLYIMEKEVLNSASVDNTQRTFDFLVKNPDGTLHETIELRDGQQKILNNLLKGATYSVYEGQTGKVYNNDGTAFQEFTISDYYNDQSITYDGTTLTGAVPADGLTTIAAVPIKADTGGDKHIIVVTNGEIANKAILTVTKKLEALTPGTTRTNALQAVTPVNQTFDFTLASTQMDDDITFSLEADESKTFTDIGFYEYTLTEYTANIAPYAPKAGEQGKTFTVTLYDVLNDTTLGKKVDFINTYNTGSDANKRTFEATKEWLGGDSADYDDAVLNLYRQVVGGNREIVDVQPTRTAIDATTFTYTWTDLPKISSDGKLYTYSVEEDNVVDDEVVINEHTYGVAQTGNTITNTFVVQQTDDLIARKTWDPVNDPGVTKPGIRFELWRSGGTAGTGELVVPATDLTNDQVNFGKHPKSDANGVDYTYYVKEVFDDPDNVLNQNWVVTENGLNVNNRTIKDIDDPNPPIVDEKIAALTIAKEFENELLVAPMRALLAAAAPIEFTFTVTGPYGYNETVTLKAGESKTLPDLYFGEYTVTETETHGYVPTYNPEDGKVLLDKDNAAKTVTVTNSNDGGDDTTVSKTITKVWAGGPKPATVLELWRSVTNEDDEVISDVYVDEFIATATVLSETFNDLAKHDPNGYEYRYYVKEPTPPANYTPGFNQETLTVTNTYASPSTDDLIATKTWDPVNDPVVTKPGIKFELWRSGGTAGNGELVVEAIALQEGDQVNFGPQAESDENGDEYTYFVKEVFDDPDNVLNQNWVVTENGLNVNNRTIKDIDDPDNPTDEDEKIAALTITKVFMNEPMQTPSRALLAAAPIEFTFTVTGPYGYNETVTLKAGESKTLSNLYFGPYTVTETETHGYVPTYNPEDGKVLLDKDNAAKTVTVTNSNDGGDDTTVSKTITKVWAGGPKPATVLELWRSVTNEDDEVISDAYVDEFTTTATKLSETFYGLAKHDPAGNEFVYTVKEPNPPANYTPSFNQVTLTVTNTYQNEAVDYTVEHYRANDDGMYPTEPTEIENRTGTEGEVVTATPKSYPGYTYEADDSTASGTVSATTPLVLKMYYQKNIIPVDPGEPETSDKYVRISFLPGDHGRLIPNADANGKVHFDVKIGTPFGEVRDVMPSVQPDRRWRFDGWQPNLPGDRMLVEDDAAYTAQYERRTTDDNDPTDPTDPTDPEQPPLPPVTPELIKDDHFAYMFGYPDGSFQATGNITRAEVTVMFSRLMVEKMADDVDYPSPFSDVAGDAWYARNVGFMTTKGIIRGYPDGTFRPDAPVTRAEFAAIASRFDKLVAGESNFSDVAADHWAKQVIDFAFTKGWVSGYPDGTFKPENATTRAETISIVNKMLERVADKDFVQENKAELVQFNDLSEAYWAYYPITEATNGHDYEWVIKGQQEHWLNLKDFNIRN